MCYLTNAVLFFHQENFPNIRVVKDDFLERFDLRKILISTRKDARAEVLHSQTFFCNKSTELAQC